MIDPDSFDKEVPTPKPNPIKVEKKVEFKEEPKDIEKPQMKQPLKIPKQEGPTVVGKHQPIQKYSNLLRQQADPIELLNKLLDNEIRGVTGRELIRNSLDLQKLLFKGLPESTKSTISKDFQGFQTRVFSIRDWPCYTADSPHMTITIRSKTKDALMDTRAELNVIKKEAALALNIPMTENPKIVTYGVTGPLVLFVSIYEDILINIRGVSSRQHLFVIEGIGNDIILRQPFIQATNLSFNYDNQGGYQIARLSNSERTRRVSIRVARIGNKPSKTQRELFPRSLISDDEDSAYDSGKD
ncbi:hypothetical protein BP6252_03402 [Coleophoma cylindrospora]|uniref:Uncharacterized protein n=1 Tax=Coleophoma cylindrospora TaxID=1849047 RepID=A0A3D8S7W3_9HELO|nr:hypothetical protein BP6252_03402 [Coleophoma cylindrospora]